MILSSLLSKNRVPWYTAFWYYGTDKSTYRVPEELRYISINHLSSVHVFLWSYADQELLPLNSLLPSDCKWCHQSWLTLGQVMACWLTASSHYLNLCWILSFVKFQGWSNNHRSRKRIWTCRLQNVGHLARYQYVDKCIQEWFVECTHQGSFIFSNKSVKFCKM